MIIESEILKFQNVSDPIKTEETIYGQLVKKNLKIPYVAFPLAYSINTLGLEKTQEVVNEINKKHPFKKFFVCQHIFVNRIDFGGNLVFTPHTEKGDPYFFIPHYNPIYGHKPEIIKINERSIDFSFMGDFNTSPDRERLSFFNHSKCLVKPTGKWFFSHDEGAQRDLLITYKKILEDTKISICPRGTGPSTLRLFESMSVGSIPLIFNNLDLPEVLENFVIKADLQEFIEGKITEEILSKNLKDYSEGIYDAYWSGFSNQNLSNQILKIINDEY
jgi:hypothetical protein